ncbi:hypothetical protein JI58_02220 [Marinosulfonomonas sp. PRT-SC04]|nr:hypothetical protein JI58_02220 [Marinosulfonomonas sp. PRT-SC04]
MMQGEVGTFDSRMHTRAYDIAPHGRISLGTGVSTITLLRCDAVAMQLVSDQNAIRINEGATLPLNGVQRYLRNPYSKSVRVEILEDLPVRLAPRQDETGMGFVAAHGSHIGLRDNDNIAGKRKGLILMAKRGDLYFDIATWNGTNVSLIPDAKLEYQDSLPAGVFSESTNSIDSDGLPVSNYVVRHGIFTDAEMGQWIADSGWNRAPVLISQHYDKIEGVLKHGTALVLADGVGYGFEANINITDLGDWHPEWLR